MRYLEALEARLFKAQAMMEALLLITDVAASDTDSGGVRAIEAVGREIEVIIASVRVSLEDMLANEERERERAAAARRMSEAVSN